ncbi:MAG: hypothetical protein IKC48_04560 [Clostridia bacterium]|nr:hypothetical protein [Clostridia bacterium]
MRPEETLNLIAEGKLVTEPLITHTYPLSKIDEADELFENKRDGVIKDNGRVKLPFCLQVHHSICDGYHAGQFFDYLQNLADEAYGRLK